MNLSSCERNVSYTSRDDKKPLADGDYNMSEGGLGELSHTVRKKKQLTRICCHKDAEFSAKPKFKAENRFQKTI